MVGGRDGTHLMRRDPTLVVLAFAVWSGLSGVSLLWPGEMFTAGVSYRGLTKLGVPEEVWGSAMVCDAVVLVWTTLRMSLAVRAAAAVLSGAFWVYFGIYVVIGGLDGGVFSAVGCWEVTAGLGLLAAAVQWVGHGENGDGE